MDEAFMPFEKIIRRMLSFGDELIDEEQGVHSYIYEYEIESPVELDVVIGEHGQLQIGSTPPLYYVDTSIRPSFHRLKFRADLSQVSDGE
jgi:hypothetical protein